MLNLISPLTKHVYQPQQSGEQKILFPPSLSLSVPYVSESCRRVHEVHDVTRHKRVRGVGGQGNQQSKYFILGRGHFGSRYLARILLEPARPLQARTIDQWPVPRADQREGDGSEGWEPSGAVQCLGCWDDVSPPGC